MSLNINGQEIGRKEIVIVTLCLIALAVTLALVTVHYVKQKENAQAIQEQQTAQQVSAKNEEMNREMQRQADLNKLVSICMAAQERFDGLTLRQQAAETRPDCTVSVQ